MFVAKLLIDSSATPMINIRAALANRRRKKLTLNDQPIGSSATNRIGKILIDYYFRRSIKLCGSLITYTHSSKVHLKIWDMGYRVQRTNSGEYFNGQKVPWLCENYHYRYLFSRY